MQMNPLPQLAMLVAASALVLPAGAQSVTSPEAHLGRPVGADFELADWQEVSSYFEKLGRESPNVETRVIGTTTEGRDFLLSVISSAENLAQLDDIQRHARVLADPRRRSDEDKRDAVANGRVLLFISCAMHATETAAPQMGMELAYLLATSEEEPWKSAREEVVVLLAPTLNPDGLDHVVSWYRETVGTPFEAAGLLKLYQKYAGHDNNRDWFMLTQVETRIVTEQLYSIWHPQVYWDVHQQGSSGERMFVPPFRDPLNPNLDPAIIAGIDALGSRALLDLTRAGFRGISTGVSYDMWWNGGNRNVPVRHNIIGLLTEAASVRIATPMFLPRSQLRGPRGLGEYQPSNRFPDPWPGGWWRLRDIIDYELAFARSLLGSLARERELWLANALEASERTIRRGREEAPRAWLIPSDNADRGAVRRLVHTLLLSGVEVHVSEDELEVEGRTWPAGTIVVRRDQPYGSHVKDLFELQEYPAGDPPYDVAGWTLPLLLGIHRVEVREELEAPLVRVTNANAAIAAFGGDERVGGIHGDWLSSRDSDSWPALVRGLGNGQPYSFCTVGDRAGLFIPGTDTANQSEGPLVLRSVPRIGLYAPWQGNMDEGWMRWVFDTNHVPYTSVRNEMLRAGALGDFLDVLILPSISARQLDDGRAAGSVPTDYTGGLAPEGAVAVEEFVRRGGTLITLGRSSQWAVDLFQLPLVDVTRGEEGEGFACPGSVLRAIAGDDPQAADLADSLAVFFSRSSAFREMTDEEREEHGLSKAARGKNGAGEDGAKEGAAAEPPVVLLRYAPTRLLYSGWIEKPELIEGRAAWLRASYGAGTVHLFAFRPQYRGWSQGVFQLVFRACLLPLDGQ